MSDREERLSVQYILGEDEYAIYHILKEDFFKKRILIQESKKDESKFTLHIKNYISTTSTSKIYGLNDTIQCLYDNIKRCSWDGVWVQCSSIAYDMVKDNDNIQFIVDNASKPLQKQSDLSIYSKISLQESTNLFVTYFAEKLAELKTIELYIQALYACELEAKTFETLNVVLKKEQVNISHLEQNATEIFNKVYEYLCLKNEINTLESKMSHTNDKYLATARLKTMQQKKAAAEFQEKRMQKKAFEPTAQTSNKTSEGNSSPKTHLLSLLVAMVLFFSMFELPYGYYTFARIVVFGAMLWYTFVVWMLNDGEFSYWQVPTVLMAILWNPILPIHFEQDIWTVLDSIGIIICIAESIYSYRIARK